MSTKSFSNVSFSNLFALISSDFSVVIFISSARSCFSILPLFHLVTASVILFLENSLALKVLFWKHLVLYPLLSFLYFLANDSISFHLFLYIIFYGSFRTFLFLLSFHNFLLRRYLLKQICQDYYIKRSKP